MQSELRKQEYESENFSKEKLAFKFFFEERNWYIAAIIDDFNEVKFESSIAEELSKRVRKVK
jgi:hypothetical protein